jgi:hypothetical protein
MLTRGMGADRPYKPCVHCHPHRSGPRRRRRKAKRVPHYLQPTTTTPRMQRPSPPGDGAQQPGRGGGSSPRKQRAGPDPVTRASPGWDLPPPTGSKGGPVAAGVGSSPEAQPWSLPRLTRRQKAADAGVAAEPGGRLEHPWDAPNRPPASRAERSSAGPRRTAQQVREQSRAVARQVYPCGWASPGAAVAAVADAMARDGEEPGGQLDQVPEAQALLRPPGLGDSGELEHPTGSLGPQREPGPGAVPMVGGLSPSPPSASHGPQARPEPRATRPHSGRRDSSTPTEPLSMAGRALRPRSPPTQSEPHHHDGGAVSDGEGDAERLARLLPPGPPAMTLVDPVRGMGYRAMAAVGHLPRARDMAGSPGVGGPDVAERASPSWPPLRLEGQASPGRGVHGPEDRGSGGGALRDEGVGGPAVSTACAPPSFDLVWALSRMAQPPPPTPRRPRRTHGGAGGPETFFITLVPIEPKPRPRLGIDGQAWEDAEGQGGLAGAWHPGPAGDEWEEGGAGGQQRWVPRGRPAPSQRQGGPGVPVAGYSTGGPPAPGLQHGGGLGGDAPRLGMRGCGGAAGRGQGTVLLFQSNDPFFSGEEGFRCVG